MCLPIGIGPVDPETMAELLAGIEEDERALGGRSAGVLSLREASGEGTDVAVGDSVVAAVVQPEGPDGRVVLSTRRARRRRQWARMSELVKSGEVVEAEVVEANRGGLVVDLGLRGFVPLSQLASVGKLGGRGAEPPDWLHEYVGKRLPLRVIEADQRRDRLILSQKAAAQQLRRRRKEEASSRLEEGQVLDGTVSSVTTFGTFVDVGSADGLVHRSEITWEKGGSTLRRFIGRATACVSSLPMSTASGVASPYLSSG